MRGWPWFVAIVVAGLVAGSTFGYFAIRPDLVGMCVGGFILLAPLFPIAVVVGVVQVRREASDGRKVQQ